MSNPFLGEVVLFAGNFAPRGWAFCAGQILAISTNTALFSILGTTYGGNGQTTFALPDLRSRVATGQGQGPGLSSYTLGQQSGTETVTLNAQQLPPHQHTAMVFGDTGDSGKPAGNFLAGIDNGYKSTSDGTQLNGAMIGGGGSSQPHDNIQPYTTLNYIICVEGLYPSRN
jgi:microcystin-dependent protein